MTEQPLSPCIHVSSLCRAQRENLFPESGTALGSSFSGLGGESEGGTCASALDQACVQIRVSQVPAECVGFRRVLKDSRIWLLPDAGAALRPSGGPSDVWTVWFSGASRTLSESSRGSARERILCWVGKLLTVAEQMIKSFSSRVRGSSQVLLAGARFGHQHLQCGA